ncbi:MAG: hypothetical protein K2K54_05290 [Lachnospiraceae bacterium]|nr:hypothetical protein [Lachnospiraceae bacterium]
MDRSERVSNIKKTIKGLVVPFLVLIVITGFVFVIVFTQKEVEQEEIIKVNAYEEAGEDIVLENEYLKFVMDSSTTQFSLTQKSTGEIWYSNPPDAKEDPIALQSDKENLQSTLLLTYSTINGVDTIYNNYKYSIESKIYNIEVTDDKVKVLYSIGEVEKEYIIPNVIEADRMEELFAVMSTEDATRAKDYYKKYDINNLGKKDDKEALLEQYPILEEKVIYVLRSGAKDNIKKKLEQIFLSAGYTQEEYMEEKALYEAASGSEKPVFNVSMEYWLEGNDLVVNVPMEEMEYKEDYPLVSLQILPYFGAGGSDENGYLFVPEGGGALIRFNNGKTAQNSYFSNVYGWDMALGRDYVVHETRAYFGVYGIAKENNSMICILENGAEYASIIADISGRTNSYNYVNASYSILHREQVDVADKYNGAMFFYEQQIPKENLTQRFRFVDSGNYVDMAKSYQGYLQEKYLDAYTGNTDEHVPVAIEILGAIDKVEQVLGVPVSKPLKVTGYSEAKEMLETLEENNVCNISVKLSGWMNNGIKQKLSKDIDLIPRLGSKKELTALTAYTSENGMKLYLDSVTNYAYDSDITDGFFVFRDAARLVSKEKVELLEYSTIYYSEQTWKDPYYLLNPALAVEMMSNISAAAGKYGAYGISFRDVGYQLSADYNVKNLTTRQEAKNMQLEQLEQIVADGYGIMTNMGNDYVLGVTDYITNMDLGGSGYTIIDEKVPFYQIAIHGFVNYSGKALNLAGDYQEELLKSAEYGAGLNFTFMAADSTILQNTYYTQYYGADFDAWHEKMLEIYADYEEALGHVFNQTITDHIIVAAGVRITVYEDGTKVYVNYNNEDYKMEDGTVLPARDYLVIR